MDCSKCPTLSCFNQPGRSGCTLWPWRSECYTQHGVLGLTLGTGSKHCFDVTLKSLRVQDSEKLGAILHEEEPKKVGGFFLLLLLFCSTGA
jgi:hypothetical protein